MIKKKLEEIEGNEVLARDVISFDYQIILSRGMKVRKEYVEKLKELGITEVFVQNDTFSSKEVSVLRSETEESIKETVKKVLERHTYHNNKELHELEYAADEIISSILEEEKVAEKIFDIKERSADLYEHSINVCAIAILTSLKLGVEISKIHDIGVGCLLHDIGHRYLTVSCENKAMETMNRQELIEYKKHPVYGFSALRNESWLSESSKAIILYHHERLDGSGFPLKTTTIPYECQIVGVCDAFDEMICGIACEKMKVHEAIEYLKNFKSILFDEKIVDSVLKFIAVYPAGSYVMTNEGELAVVISQNKDFQDRPIIRIIKDKDGNETKEEVIKDLVKIHNIFIEKTMD